jgi:hypothetical protein
MAMAKMTKISDDIHPATKEPRAHVKLGSLLAEIGRSAGLTDEDCDALHRLRDDADNHVNWTSPDPAESAGQARR